jgi:uncharacterized protein (DUF1684 family)
MTWPHTSRFTRGAIGCFAALLAASCGRSEPAPASTPPASTPTASVSVVSTSPSTMNASDRADDEAFRRERETKLTSDTGWLTIAGLEFLTKPETTFGSDPSNDIVLPGATPTHVGTFMLAKNGRISVTLAPGLHVKLLDGRSFSGGPIKTDGEGPPDRMVLGDVQVWVHMSGARPAVRIRDRNNPLRKTFTGMKWYPIDGAYRVEATYRPFDKPRALKVPNLLGDIDDMTAPGQVTFTLNGMQQTMMPVIDGDELWFIFKDGTSNDTTYPAARFLYTPMPKDGKVVIDFNRAENPPCAFNPYATCPLPPKENQLAMRIQAGEKYEKH